MYMYENSSDFRISYTRLSRDKLIVNIPNYCPLKIEKEKEKEKGDNAFETAFKLTNSFGDNCIYGLKWNTLYRDATYRNGTAIRNARKQLFRCFFLGEYRH